MKINVKVTDANGKVVKSGQKTTRNIPHFQTQLVYRQGVKESKRVYNRSREKSMLRAVRF